MTTLISAVPDLDDEADAYLMAKSYFDLSEYDRAAFFTKDCQNPKTVFLHFYSRYLSAEKKYLDDMTECITNQEEKQLAEHKVLRAELEKLYLEKVT